jgi:RNA-directed DNA polymerase
VQKKVLLIKPHPEKITALKKKLRETWIKYKGQSTIRIIKELNPIIRCWANYYKPFSSSKTFSKLDYFMWYRSWRYAKRRHSQKNHTWIVKRYYTSREGSSSKWRFYTLDGKAKLFLLRFSDFKITRHVMVRSDMVPDDNSLEARAYWEKRILRRKSLMWDNYERRNMIAQDQFHLCPICRETLYNEEKLYIYYITLETVRVEDTYLNFILLHEPCYSQVHSLKIADNDVYNRINNLINLMKAKFKKDFII